MGKARRIEGLSATDSYSVAAAEIVRVRVAELIDAGRGILDVGDIERVHDMRVATRRLRAALEIFESCFPRKELKAAIKEVKVLADVLGERRDRDVAIAALESIETSLAAPDRPGVTTLIERLRSEQHGANEELARFVAGGRLASLGDQLSALVARVSPASPGDGDPSSQIEEPGARDNGAGMLTAVEDGT